MQQVRGVEQSVAVCCGQLREFVGANLGCEEHIGEIGVGFGCEPFMCVFPKYDRGKGPEAFAEFDLQVECSLDGV